VISFSFASQTIRETDATVSFNAQVSRSAHIQEMTDPDAPRPDGVGMIVPLVSTGLLVWTMGAGV
jgi:hypothetical protein